MSSRTRKAKSQKKRRDKRYTGEDAAIRGVKVTKITAVRQPWYKEWWQENKITFYTRSALFLFIALVATIIYAIFLIVT